MSNHPTLSIIIPTHNRRGMLEKCLAALSEQVGAAPVFEVLVVADNCTDGTAEMVASFSAHAPYRLRVFSHAAKSAGLTRNLGASYACGHLLLFLDDDIIPQKGFVQAHFEVQQENGVGLGYSKPVIPKKPSLWQYSARLWWEDMYRAMSQPGHRFSYRDFFSGNFSISAELFHRVGGFNPLIAGRLEDYELGLRLIKAGVKFFFVPEALGYHYDGTDLELWLRRVSHEGSADVKIGDLHPEIRTSVFRVLEDTDDQWGWLRRNIRQLAFSGSKLGKQAAQKVLRLTLLCDRLHLRGPWWHLMGALREYFYWVGVSQAVGGYRAFYSWLQEGSMPPAVGKDAPIIDIADLPPADMLIEALEKVQDQGLRLAIQGVEGFVIQPQPGFEPLQEEHVRSLLYAFAGQKFIPGLAIHLIQSAEGKDLACAPRLF